ERGRERENPPRGEKRAAPAASRLPHPTALASLRPSPSPAGRRKVGGSLRSLLRVCASARRGGGPRSERQQPVERLRREPWLPSFLVQTSANPRDFGFAFPVSEGMAKSE